MEYLSPKSTLSLLEQAINHFAKEPNYIRLKPKRPVIFVADTHGDYDSTRKVFKRFGKTHDLVFLGDYVDRAPKDLGSLKNIKCLLEHKLAEPESVHLLRGNHEFEDIFSQYGFGEELYRFGTDCFEVKSKFIEVFSQLPYVAETENGLLALHGGLPDIKSKDQLCKLPKGIYDWRDDNTISQIVWNDNVITDSSRLNPQGITQSSRGSPINEMFVYGEPFFSDKMNILQKEVLVRGHHQYSKGYAINDRILTIFTSTEYAEDGMIKGTYVAELKDPVKRLVDARGLRIIQLWKEQPDPCRSKSPFMICNQVLLLGLIIFCCCNILLVDNLKDSLK